MQFLSLRSDRQILPEFDDRYVHMLDVECPKCNKIVYQLYAPMLETEAEQVQAQREWLNAYLPKVCPEHPDFFLTPDRPQ